MQRYTCVCGQRIAFDNVQCLACSRRLAFAPERLAMVALEPDAARWRIAGAAATATRRLCDNYADAAVCNWLCPPDATSIYCVSCALTPEIPDLGVAGNLARWARIEAAKRRLLYDLLALDLRFDAARAPDGSALPALRFAFLADTPTAHVVTGHADGRITLSIDEADDVRRTGIREALGEPYRTLLGHLRHESGHYYFQRLLAHAPALGRFRSLFGDESVDYAAALARHYRDGARADWPAQFVSAYAAAHPHEDWAETWAHYLHIRDTLDTARAFGMSVADGVLTPDAAHPEGNFNDLIAAWLPVTLAVNELNRSMGLPDMYPFVLSPPALDKLRFVHELVRVERAARKPGADVSGL